MKKSKIKVYFDVDNKWEKEVFYLKDPNECRIVDDAGCDVDSGKYVAGPPLEYHCNLGELDVNENSAGGGAYENFALGDVGIESSLSEEEMWEKYGFHSSEEAVLAGCCPIGPKGESGLRGIDEERMYPLILDSLRKFSECQVDLSKDSACEVLADGITKKITNYMWHKE